MSLKEPKHSSQIKTREEAQYAILHHVRKSVKRQEKIDRLLDDAKCDEAEMIAIVKKWDLVDWIDL